MKIKNILKKAAAPVLMKSHHYAKWQDNQLHVLIECFSGFTEEDWRHALDKNFPDWHKYCDVRFFENFAVRDKYIPDAEILIGTWFSNELMKQALKLKLVQLTITGTEFLDNLNTSIEIQVTTAAGLSARGVAEHALLLMLALDRRLDLAIRQQGKKKWNQDQILRNIRGLEQRVAGVIGMGNIGRAVASLLSSMQMTVVYYDTRDSVHNDVAQRCASLDELLAQSDFVLLCVPLSAATRRMITAKELNRMKKSAYLINVARGEVVDERDLARRLKQHDIAGAATDVLSEEPPSFFHPLYGCPNLIITPHVAGNIYTYREAIRRRFVMNLRAFIEKKPLDGLYKQGAQGVIDGY